MDAAFVFFFSIAVFLFYHILRLWDEPRVPKLLYSVQSSFIRAILKDCPILSERYVPTSLWGRSGHLQTLVYGWLGRRQIPSPSGERISVCMPDGATNTFDVFEPVEKAYFDEIPTLMVCPGIGNNSETHYIKTLVHYMQKGGWRVVILNHLGALNDVPLTSPRIYNFGCTREWNTLVSWVRARFPNSPLLMCGISLGANLVLKYLGESAEHRRGVLAALSICQGYDAQRAVPLMERWEGARRVYSYVMLDGHKRRLKRHAHILFSEEACRELAGFSEKKLWRTNSILRLDSEYSCKRAGFKHVQDYYFWCSCKNYINNIDLPLLLLNAEDDPLVPCELHDIPRQYTASHPDSLFVLTRHGGHLGYFEGGVLLPDAVTWLDRLVLQYSNALLRAKDKLQK